MIAEAPKNAHGALSIHKKTKEYKNNKTVKIQTYKTKIPKTIPNTKSKVLNKNTNKTSKTRLKTCKTYT